MLTYNSCMAEGRRILHDRVERMKDEGSIRKTIQSLECFLSSFIPHLFTILFYFFERRAFFV